MASSREIGDKFEAKVGAVLGTLSSTFPSRVELRHRPRITLQNGEIVVPDFDLVVELPHERSFYLLECQDRKHQSKTLLQKIQYMRVKSWRQTFIYVHTHQLSENLKSAYKAEGVLVFSFSELIDWTARLFTTLKATPSLSGGPDRGMLARSDD